MGVAIATAQDLQLHQQFQAMHVSDPVCFSYEGETLSTCQGTEKIAVLFIQ